MLRGFGIGLCGPNLRMMSRCGSVRLSRSREMLLAVVFLWPTVPCCAQPASPLPLRGVISGSVFDEAGQPLPGWHVVAARWSYHHGRKELDLLPPGDTRTQHDGSFILENLDPGEYYLRAENPYRRLLDLPLVAARLPTFPAPKKAGEIYVTTYVPGVIDPASAQSIRVSAGAPSPPIRFRVQNERVFRVRGRIANGGGMMSLKLVDSLVPEDIRNVNAGADGTFEVDRLLPGAYVITGSGQQTASRAIVTVADHDLADVNVDARPCPKLKGTVTLDGAPSAPKTKLDSVIPLTHLDQAFTVFGQVNARGAFTVDCVQPDNYSIDVSFKPGQYLKSITVDGRDVTYAPVDLTSLGDKTIAIALSSHAAELRGTVRDPSGKPRPATSVTIWSAASGLNLTATSATDGTFQLGNLPPGNYRVAAWDQLYVQPPGWGVQTMHQFRDQFEAVASAIILSEGQRLSLDPALISRTAIEQAASKLHLNAVMNQTAELDAIAQAVKSPQALALFLESNRTIDWTLVRRALGLDEAWIAPCGDHFPAADSPCSVTSESVAKPDQAILVVRGGDLSYAVEYLRYLQNRNGGWQFAGEKNAYQRNSPSHHRIMQFGDKPFLAISSDLSQNGMASQQVLEEWFDLTKPDFKPVFSFTPEGGQSRYGFGVGRTINAAYALSNRANIETIQVTLTVHFNGVGFDQEATYIGLFERYTNDKAFRLRIAYSGAARRAEIPTKDFEELADPCSGLSNEKLLKYAFPGLQAVAKGSDEDSRGWLQSVLGHAKDTSEKRALLELLKR
jgi:Carboxypeptidase regulatory-like domain